MNAPLCEYKLVAQARPGTCIGEFGTIYTVVLMPCATDNLADYKKTLRAKLDEQRAEMKRVEDARAPDGKGDDSDDPTSAEHVAPGANFAPSKIEAILEGKR